MILESSSGLGVVNTDLCVWASKLLPADEPQVLIADRSMVTIVEKPHIMDLSNPDNVGLSGLGDTALFGMSSTAIEDLVCRINCWIEKHPYLAWGGLAAGYLLLKKDKDEKDRKDRR